MKLPDVSFSLPVRSGPLRILIIDDEDSMRSLFQLTLEQQGHTILTAANGEQGLQVALKQQPDIIFCDVQMPGLSGHAVLEALHRDYQTRHIPFVFLTGCSDKQSIRLGMAAGAEEYLTKPFQPGDLDEAIGVCERKLARMAPVSPARSA